MEIEAKFAIPNRPTFDRLLSTKSLGPFAVEPQGRQHVHDRFLDTAGRVFSGQHYACRLRQRGEDYLLTLKGPGRVEAAVHSRPEFEVTLPEIQTDPARWPPSEARDLALRLSDGRPLVELFTQRQTRHISTLRDGQRAVATLSLDEVEAQIGAQRLAYFELEAELLPDGTLEDLQALSAELQTDWELQPEPHSKFERGLALLDSHAEQRLRADERATLERIAAEGTAALQRRARLLLAWDEGATSGEAGERAGLSRSRVNYWLRAFRQRRMGIFPDEALHTTPLTVAELCRRYRVDMAHARHVAELALALFDLTAEVHGLPAERRDLLEKAALLHNVALTTDPARHHTTGRDVILAHPLADLDGQQRQMVAATTFLHRKKFRKKKLEAEVLASLPEAVRHDTLILAALLRMADGLDYTQSQTTTLGQATPIHRGLEIRVSGPQAGEDAARAGQKADLWQWLFPVTLRFVTDEEKPPARPPIKVPKTPDVLADEPMSEAGRKVLRFHFARMLRREAGTRLGEDIEELHDMRVATRRMRAAFRVFGDFFERRAIAPFLKGLRRTGRVLGAVRDLDVFMEKAQHYLDTLPPQQQNSLDPLLDSWRGQRQAARERMIAYLDSEKYRRFVEEFGDFLETPGLGARPLPSGHPEPYLVCHVAPRLIYTRYEAVRAYEPVLDGAPIEVLHALRIDCKRLRYTLEFFREVLGPEAKEVIEAVVIMQDHLGDLHDADVADGLLRDFLDGGTPAARKKAAATPRRRIIAPGVVAYLAAKQSELQTLIDTFPAAWQRLNRPEVRHKLALAVSVL